MIPITIGYVGGRARNRAHGFFLSLFFVLGIAIMYSALGIVAASTGSVFGSAMQSPIVLIVVAVIFTAMGASMLGAFELALPSGLQGRLTEGSMQRGGTIGAVLMGMVTGLVASPCVGPVLVVLLTFVAQTGSVLLGFWLLFTFASGLGVLFLILGTFAGAISSLPQAGGWMDTVKHVFGFILIAVAIYYLRTLIGPTATGLLAGVYLLGLGLVLGGWVRLHAGTSTGRRLVRSALGALFALAGVLVLAAWTAVLVGAPLALRGGPLLPKSLSTISTLAAIEPEWRVNDEAALEQARLEGRPVIQDFYADWCAACIELDERTWNDPEVLAETRRFTAVKMDFTHRDEFSRAATERYEVRGMPTVILYDSAGNEAARFVGFKSARDVLAVLRSIR